MSVDGLVSGHGHHHPDQPADAGRGGTADGAQDELTATQTAASAYRTVNTTFLAVTRGRRGRPQARPLGDHARRRARAPTSPPAPRTGAADRLADLHRRRSSPRTHAVVNRNAGTWTASTVPTAPPSIEVFDKDGASKGTIPIGGTQTLADAAAAINASSHGADGRRRPDQRHRVRPAGDRRGRRGAASEFYPRPAPARSASTRQAQDAELNDRDDGRPTRSPRRPTPSPSVLPGDHDHRQQGRRRDPVTVSVVADPDAVAAKMSSARGRGQRRASTGQDLHVQRAGQHRRAQGRLLGHARWPASCSTPSPSAVGADGSPAERSASS